MGWRPPQAPPFPSPTQGSASAGEGSHASQGRVSGNVSARAPRSRPPVYWAQTEAPSLPQSGNKRQWDKSVLCVMVVQVVLVAVVSLHRAALSTSWYENGVCLSL